MIIPVWVLFGIGAAVLSAIMMLLQERLKIEGFALAIWCKIACIIFTLPFVLMYGLPQNPLFYAFLGLQALIFAINDVLLFKAIPQIGAGVVSRLIPLTTLFGFLLWFLIEPSLIEQYLQKPAISALILRVLLMTTYFAMRLRKCHVSLTALRVIWFVILANTVGPIIAKIVTTYVPVGQGGLAFTFVEAWMMMAMWVAYLLIAKPIPVSALFVPNVWKGGMLIGCVMAAMIIVHVTGFYHVDNPGYISAIKLVDAVMIVGAHRLLGHNDGSDIWAGLGIVICAIILTILKTQI